MENILIPTKTSDKSVEIYTAGLKRALEDYVFKEVTLNGITYPTVPPPILEIILSASHMHHFTRSFTDPSFDYDESYEAGETIGDLHCNSFQGKRIKREKPNMTPSEISNMLAYYKSNQEYGKSLKEAIPNVEKLIRSVAEIKEKVYADILESLIYAVEEACRSVVPGMGMNCAENVFLLLTRNKIGRAHV